MELNVRIDRNLEGFVPDAVAFETGCSRAQLEDPSSVVYDHHGADFSTFDRGALPSFYEDLLLGRAMPPVFATPRIQDIDTVLAIALFLHRDLATHPATAGLVYTVDFVHRLGLPALAHIPEDLARFLSALRTYFPETGISKREMGERITTAVSWIRDYLHEDKLPVLGGSNREEVRVLNHGTTGFVVAETQGSLWDGWVELFRTGFLRGVVVDHSQGDRQRVLAARKSHYVPLDLITACRLLNQMELAMGELPEWQVTRDGLWLESPKEGSLILLQDLLDVLLRL